MAKNKTFFDMQRFKFKCMAEGGKVTLQHADGHELSIFPKAIKNAEFRAMLEAIAKDAGKSDKKKLADGGLIPEYDENSARAEQFKAVASQTRGDMPTPQQAEQPSQQRNIRSNARRERNEQMLKQGKSPADIQADERSNPMRYADGGQVAPSNQDAIMAQINQMQMPQGMQPQYIDQPQQMPQQSTIGGTIADMGRALMTPAGQAVPMNAPQPQIPMQTPQVDVQQAQPPQQPIAPQAPANADPAGLSAYSNTMMGGLDKQRQALELQYQAAAQEGQKKAAADIAYQAELKKTQDDFNQSIAANQANINATLDDIKNNAINPKAYQESMSSGNKIASAIGLMAGGFGQAFVGGDNPAMTFLNKQIDRDIAAQESNKANKVTLLNAYQQQFQNKMAATNMAKATLSSLYASQVSLAANQAATPQAKAAMLAGAGALQMKAAELVKSATLAEYMTKLQGGDIQQSPEKIVQTMEMINPEKAKELRERMVPGVGFATTNEGRKTAVETQIMASNVKKDITRLRQIMATPIKSMNLNLRAEADTIRRSLIGSLRLPITGPGAMSDGERELLLQIVPDVTSITSLDSNSAARLNTIEAKMDNAYKHTLEANGMKLPQGYARHPNEGKVAVNPQGQRIIMKNGQWVPYGQ